MKSKLRWFRGFLVDSDRKSLPTIVSELIALNKKAKTLDDLGHYFSCLVYKKEAGVPANYLPRKSYIQIIKEYYRINGEHPILQDKNVFSTFLSNEGLPTAMKIGEIIKGKLISKDQIVETSLEDSIKQFVNTYDTIFVKQVDSEGGKGVFRVDKSNLHENFEIKQDSNYIIEREIKQHEDLIKINPYCLNTLRVITVLKGDIVLIPDCFFRMGTGKSYVDNGSSGGIFINYDIHNNRVGKVAYKLPESGGYSYYEHPTTKVVFDGKQLPYPEKVIELVSKGAKLFKDKELIGWDIAYTPDGPVILEANDNPHIVMMQISSKGLRSNELYREVFKRYLND